MEFIQNFLHGYPDELSHFRTLIAKQRSKLDAMESYLNENIEISDFIMNKFIMVNEIAYVVDDYITRQRNLWNDLVRFNMLKDVV